MEINHWRFMSVLKCLSYLSNSFFMVRVDFCNDYMTRSMALRGRESDEPSFDSKSSLRFMSSSFIIIKRIMRSMMTMRDTTQHTVVNLFIISCTATVTHVSHERKMTTKSLKPQQYPALLGLVLMYILYCILLVMIEWVSVSTGEMTLPTFQRVRALSIIQLGPSLFGLLLYIPIRSEKIVNFFVKIVYSLILIPRVISWIKDMKLNFTLIWSILSTKLQSIPTILVSLKGPAIKSSYELWLHIPVTLFTSIVLPISPYMKLLRSLVMSSALRSLRQLYMVQLWILLSMQQVSPSIENQLLQLEHLQELLDVHCKHVLLQSFRFDVGAVEQMMAIQSITVLLGATSIRFAARTQQTNSSKIGQFIKKQQQYNPQLQKRMYGKCITS